MNEAIIFENVGKQYRLGLVGTGTLQHDLNRWFQTSILRKEDPYLKIGEVNDRSTKGHSDYVWALKDISFKVEQGDVVGIIGKNGAGKSTLLKLLSHITAPTTGHITYKGRIASLLEVGTGFHPEMTARENIYMNGSIMGMTRHEITRKLDDIVDFAGIERYLDTPVKRFSSGMKVRLGFAVAAFLEPEILVVDEVLAVGDLDFQKKAIGKMQDVSQERGRTVLFVSHNMNSVKLLCNRGIVLNNGTIEYRGTADECVEFYSDHIVSEMVDHAKLTTKMHSPGFSKDIELLEVSLLNQVDSVATDEPLVIEMTLKRNNLSRKQCQYSVIIRDTMDVCPVSYTSEMSNIPQDREIYKVRIRLDSHGLPKGIYKLGFNVGIKNYGEGTQHYDVAPCGTLAFEVKYMKKATKQEYLNWRKGACYVLHDKELMNVHVL